MFKEVDAQTAVNALIDGNEKVFVITHVDSNVKIAPLTDYSIAILSDPQIKDGYRYIIDDGTITSQTEADDLTNGSWTHDGCLWHYGCHIEPCSTTNPDYTTENLK